MEEFTENDEVSELKCDERHIFHTECIKMWMKSDAENNLKCPICKREVNVDGSAPAAPADNEAGRWTKDNDQNLCNKS